MPRLGWLALLAACTAAICLWLPWPGLFAGMGLAIMAVGAGVAGWSRRGDPGPARLAGAGAITLGLMAFLLAGLEYGLTLVALGKLEQLL